MTKEQIMEKHLKAAIARAYWIGAALGLTGCVAADFKPLTMEGAQCKQECVQSMQRCEGSSYPCDRSYTLCIDACVDIEAMALKGER
jgi:hypothetical protein